MFLKTTVCFCVAHLIALKGSTALLTELNRPQYYGSVLLGLAATLVTWEMVKTLNAYLQKRYDWIDRPAVRLISQFLVCLIAPLLSLSFLVVDVFIVTDGLSSMNQEQYFRALMVTTVFVLSLNIGYLARYLYLRLKEAESVLRRDFPYFSRIK